jgi:hypothetical protein
MERDDLRRLICQYHQWAIKARRVDPNLVVANRFQHQGQHLGARHQESRLI